MIKRQYLVFDRSMQKVRLVYKGATQKGSTKRSLTTFGTISKFWN